MIAVPAELVVMITTSFWQVWIVFLRVAAFSSLIPAFGEQSVPVRVRLGLAFAFTLVTAPAVPAIAHSGSVANLAGLSLAEISIGLAMGLLVRLFVFALQVAGSIAAQSTSLSQLLGAATGEPVAAIGQVLIVAGLALAVMSGLHIRVAELLIGSYELFPVGVAPPAGEFVGWAVSRIAASFSLGFSLALPFVIASLLYNLTLGVINRAMPQLMVAFVGAPVITFGGMALLALGAPFILSTWLDALNSFLTDPIGVRR